MGYQIQQRLITYQGDPDTEFEGLEITVRQMRTGAEMTALRTAKIWADLHDLLAPYIVAWNIEGPAAITEEVPAIMSGDVVTVPARMRTITRMEPLPPPAEYGPAIFESVPLSVKEWILARMFETMSYREEDPKKENGRSEPMPSGKPDTTPETVAAKPRRSRSSSRKLSAAT